MGDPIPTIPNEIISKILSNLGKNDLLKCRLVNQSWNGLSLKILRNPKYGHEHELTQYNIQKFLEFFSERKEEWVLPFHLNFGPRSSFYGMFKFYPQILNYILQLQSIFGEKCVGGLTLSDNSSPLKYVEKLISILTLVAPSLTHLDLSKFQLCYKEVEAEKKVKEMLEKTQFNLPNLSKLKSCPAPPIIQYSTIRADNDIHSFLIAKSQNLTEVEVISPSDLLDLQKHIGSLKKLKIVNQFALKNVDIDTFLDIIRASPNPPVLNELSLICSTELLDHQILTEFLSSFSTSLQRLMLKFYEVPENPFPKLSRLKFLRIQVLMSNKNRIPVNLEQLNLNSETFPVLHSLDIQTNVYFESTLANSWDSTGNCTDESSLPTVKHLSIRVLDSPFTEDEMDENLMQEDQSEYEEITSRVFAKDYVDHLQELFPNVTSLTLVNESEYQEEYLEYLKQVLIAFIQSDGAPKIQELEIQNCENNYLGHILNGLDQDLEPRVIIENMTVDEEFLKAIKNVFRGFCGRSDLKAVKQLEFRDGAENRVITCNASTPLLHKMTGLEKIRMSFLKNLYHKSSNEVESNQKDLYLMSLPNHLPLLRQINISQQMFGDDKEFCKQQIINVQNTFPDLFINTTN